MLYTVGSNTAHYPTYVSLRCYRSGSPGTVTVSIYAVDGSGNPTGAAISTGSLNGNDFSTSATWYNFTMSPITTKLSASTQDCFVVSAPSGDSSNCVKWRAKASSGYSGGTAWRSSNSGSTWSDWAADGYFRIWGITE